MEQQKYYSALCDAIEFSELLEDDQKFMLIEAIENGEPFSEDLADVITQFAKATIALENFEKEMMQDRLNELDKKIAEIDKQPVMTEEEIQESAKKIINLVDNFLAESKKMESELDKKIEKVIHEQGENAEIDAIRNSLKK